MYPIYLDNHSTTKVDPRVLDSMIPWFSENYGNPSSRSHQHGWKAEEAVEQARTHVASLIKAKPSEIIFTSGATESNNFVLKGISRSIVTTKIEHKSILSTCSWIKSISNRNINYIDVDNCGKININLSNFLTLIKPYDLVSIMMANNEVGTINNIDFLNKFPSILIHSDMAQSLGKIPIDIKSLGVNFASFSAHKIYGPKGVGALYIDENVSHLLSPLIHGGGQEQGIRSGTLNVPSIVGFGKACEILETEQDSENSYIFDLRNKLEKMLLDSIPGSIVHGALGLERLPGNINISLPCKDINSFMAYVSDKVSLSLGSACMSNSGKSHVLSAMGISDEEILRSIRIGIGRFNTEEEINEAAKAIIWALEMSNK